MEDKTSRNANEANTDSETENILAVFKAKVEEAVQLVDKIPAEQKEEALKFWDLVSRTIQTLTQTDQKTSILDKKESDVIQKGKSKACKNTQRKTVKNRQRKIGRGKTIVATNVNSNKESIDESSDVTENKELAAQATSIPDSDVIVESIADKNKLNLDEIVIHSLDFSDLISFPGSAQSDVPYHDSQATPDVVLSKEENHMNTPNHLPDEDHVHVRLPCNNQIEVIKCDEHNSRVVIVHNVPAEEKENTSPTNQKKLKSKNNQDTKNSDSNSTAKENDTSVRNNSSVEEKSVASPCKRTQRKRKARQDDSYVYERHNYVKKQLGDDEKDIKEEGEEEEDDEYTMETISGWDVKPRRRRRRLKKSESEEQDVKCNICQMQLSSTASLEVHMRKHTGDRPFACQKCGKSFTTNGNLQRHERSHIGYRPYQCKVCKKTFTESKSLKVHMRSHTGERPFKCQYCEKSFTQSGVLQSHLALHTGVKKHLCDLCGKEFIQRSNLQIHVKRHMNNRQYKCLECDVAFFTKTELDRHAQKHTGHRPFLCSYCPKTFSRMQYLKEHMNQHLGNRPYSCKVCDKKFFDQPSLHRHKKKHQQEEEKKNGKGSNNTTNRQNEAENVSCHIDNESDTEETAVDHIIMTTDEVLSNETLQQLKAVISQEAERMQVQGDHEQMEIILTPDPSSISGDSTSKHGQSHILSQKSSDSGQQEVYITINPGDFSPDHSQVVAAVDFSAINLLANATTGQISFS